MDGAGHNNIEKFAYDYLPRIRAFIEHVEAFWGRQELEVDNRH